MLGCRLDDIVGISWLLVSGALILSNIIVSRVDGHLVARPWLFPSELTYCQKKLRKMVAGKSSKIRICCTFSSGRICLTKRRSTSDPENYEHLTIAKWSDPVVCDSFKKNNLTSK